MKFPWTIVAVLAANSLTAMPKSETSTLDTPSEAYRWSASIEGDVKERFHQLNLPFRARYDEQVRSTIKDYVTNGYRDTEAMLARQSAFFPIFEHYLHLYGLPKELRYLPIVETGLQVKAYSSAGAAGLWQFIPSSARLYGLKINSVVDERLDPYRSTEAAVSMLARLHEQYRDWSLVLAAYNCGPVRVNAAIREAGCRDYYTVADYLPQETQNYIPRFIAAAYISNFYADHGLKPRFDKVLGKPLAALPIYEEVTMGELAHASGVPVAELQLLNPAFRRSYVPRSRDGYFFLLPKQGLTAAKAFLAARNGRSDASHLLLYPNFHRTEYIVQSGESIEDVAARFKCTVSELQSWNHLRKPEIVVNQELTLYLPDFQLVARP